MRPVHAEDVGIVPRRAAVVAQPVELVRDHGVAGLDDYLEVRVRVNKIGKLRNFANLWRARSFAPLQSQNYSKNRFGSGGPVGPTVTGD